MNNAVVTFNFNGAEPILNLTFPFMKKYADKIGADIEVINQSDLKTIPKFHLYFLFLKYKRIICFNPNVLIRDDCPNLFEVVNEREIGLYDEGAVQPRYENMYLYCKITQNMINEKKWTKEFYNLGVIVASRIHKEIFKPPQQIAETPLFDQACITQRIFNNDSIKVHNLDYKFNRLPFLDILVGQSRLDSYILQYESNNLSEIYEVMQRDIQTWKNDSPEYKYQKRIVFKVGGGMGDQLCAEPTIRYSMDKLFKDAEINIITHWPELFLHLVDKGVKVYKDDSYLKTTNLRDNPVRVLETMPDTKELIWQVVPHTICHGVDFCSMAAIHRLIPDEYKQFKMGMSMEAMIELLEIFNVNETKDYILVHPGKGWDSKTFPKEWWNKVIKDLSETGEKVAVIGKYISKKQGYVDVDIPDGVLDLRDILSVQAMFLLIGQAKMVISNDSAPIHIAGAFDNWIILIPTCKHPDNVLPYRHGTKNYKSCSLYKKLTVDYIDSSPTRLSSQTLDWVEGDILDYLPEPEDVVNKAIEICKEIKSENVSILNDMPENCNCDESCEVCYCKENNISNCELDLDEIDSEESEIFSSNTIKFDIEGFDNSAIIDIKREE
jgi:hypothetical protein